MRISDWSSDVCSSDLPGGRRPLRRLPSLAPGRCSGTAARRRGRPHGCRRAPLCALPGQKRTTGEAPDSRGCRVDDLIKEENSTMHRMLLAALLAAGTLASPTLAAALRIGITGDQDVLDPDQAGTSVRRIRHPSTRPNMAA